jgi:hypothetical protein
MGDAQSMSLHLVSLGSGEPIHDWNWIFSHMGILPFDHVIADFIWLLALSSMLLCFATGSWLIWQMAKPVR